jgi:hypothetical protein
VFQVTVRGEVTSPESVGQTVVMLGGEGFVGCILEGPSLVISGAEGTFRQGVNVQWGQCPMDHTSCKYNFRCSCFYRYRKY